MRPYLSLFLPAIVLSLSCSHRDSAAPTPLPTASAVASPASATVADAGPVAPTDPSPFFVAAESGRPFRVYALTNATLVHSGAFVGRLEKDKIVYEAPMVSGLGLGKENWSIAFLENIFGSWPSEAWALERGSTGRVGFSIALRWEKDKWVQRRGLPPGRVIGSVLQDESGYVGAWYEQMGSGYGLQSLSGQRPLAQPAQVSAAEKKACHTTSTPRTRLLVRDLVATPHHGIYALGGWDECAKEYATGDAPVVDHWSPKTNTWKQIPLPRTKNRKRPEYGYAAYGGHFATPDGLYLSFEDALYFLTDETVKEVVLPPEVTKVNSLVALSTGELIVVSGSGSVYRFAIGSKAQRLALPLIDKHPAHAFRITRLADDDLFVAASDKASEDADAGDTTARFALFRTKPTATYDVSQEFAEANALVHEPPSAFSSSCKRPLVLLYEVLNTTPADFDFAATAAAIASDPGPQAFDFVEFKYGGKRFLGAKLILDSDAEGEYQDYTLRSKPLIKAIESGVKGAQPKLVCHAPKALRVLRFDAATKTLRPKTR